jgi:thiol-disulfide isomerase/thioredoxin
MPTAENMRVSPIFLFVIFFAAAVAAQIAPQPAPPSEAMRLLNEVTQKCADAKTYHLEAIEEQTSTNELHREWRKTIMSVIEASGDRYRYEGRSAFGSAIVVSDGKTVWKYHDHEHLYTQQPVATGATETRRIMEMEEEGVNRARYLRRDLAHLADRLKSAALLPEETVAVNGDPRRCYVLHYNDEDLKTKYPDATEEMTIWIDKERNVIVKTLRRGQSYTMLPGSNAHIPFLDETTTFFSVVELDGNTPVSSFVFTPPANAKLVDEFPTTKAFKKSLQSAKVAESKAAADFLGKSAPAVLLKSADGKLISLSSFIGHPVVIDLWATWCAGCIDMISDLKKLYSDVGDKGLVFLTVDHQDDAATATNFLAREHVPWRNFHDEDGAMEKAFKPRGIPFQVVIDRDGKVVFYQAGDDIGKLRTAIAKLGAEYSSVALPASTKPQ